MKTTVAQTTAPFTRFLNYATGVAVALAVMAALAAPAFADRQSDNFAKTLAAIAAIAIIANQIDKADEAPKPAPDPAPVRHPRVPAVCGLQIDIAGGQGRFFSEHCMRREGIKARLPRDCAKRAEIYGRVDRIFPEWCLREAGFRTRGQ